MIKIPLTEVTSGKQYTLLIPTFRSDSTGRSIKNNTVTLIDSVNSISMNVPLQLDMYDNEVDFTGEEITNFVTNSGKKLQIKRLSRENVLEFIINVEISGSIYNVTNVLAVKRYGLMCGIRIDGINYSRTNGKSILYHANEKRFYTTAGNTSYTSAKDHLYPDGTKHTAFRGTADDQTSPPTVNDDLYGIKQCIYNPNSTNVLNLIEISNFTTWFNRLDSKDWNSVDYPNQNPDNDNDNSGQPPADKPSPGDGDTSSDPIPDPPRLPTFDVTNTGFVVIYNPTVIEISQLAYFMWSGDFADLIKKVFREPFSAIISLKMLFVKPVKGASQTVWLGNVETTVSMSKIIQQFVDVDMGSITINEFFGSFADYAPFTKIQIFLPFIGYKDLSVDEVMNSQLHLQYRVDVYSGACIAFLTVTKDIKSTHLDSILYQFDGNCAMEIPFTSNDNSRYVAAILNSTASSALSLAGSSTFTQAQAPYMFDKGESAKLTIGSLAPVANGLLDIMSTKPNVQRAGSLAGAVAAMGVKQPYIVIHRPIAHMPGNYQHYIGIPLNLSRTLSDVKGYTIVSQVFMSSASATDEEIEMITEMLKAGVIF